jgi:hypothetical protein
MKSDSGKKRVAAHTARRKAKGWVRKSIWLREAAWPEIKKAVEDINNSSSQTNNGG